MTPKYAKVSQIADRFRVSVDAVYLWIRQGKIPSDCVARIAGTVRVDEEQFEQRLRSGALFQPRGRKRPALPEPESGKPLVSKIAEDNFSTVGNAPPAEGNQSASVNCRAPTANDIQAALTEGKRKHAAELWQKLRTSVGLHATKRYLYTTAAQDRAEYYRWERGELPDGSQADRDIRKVLLKPFS